MKYLERYITGTQVITMRVGPCGCGCGGTDPWHRTVFRRVVRNVRPYRDSSPSFYGIGTIAVGTIKAPWGEQEVRLEAHVERGVIIGWRKSE